MHLVGFLQPRITMHGTTNIKFNICCIWSYPEDGGSTLLRNVSAYVLTSFHDVIFLTKCLHQCTNKLIATALIVMIMQPSCPENVRAWPGHRYIQNRHITGAFVTNTLCTSLIRYCK